MTGGFVLDDACAFMSVSAVVSGDATGLGGLGLVTGSATALSFPCDCDCEEPSIGVVCVSGSGVGSCAIA